MCTNILYYKIKPPKYISKILTKLMFIIYIHENIQLYDI
jgi:hypothetical protein